MIKAERTNIEDRKEQAARILRENGYDAAVEQDNILWVTLCKEKKPFDEEIFKRECKTVRVILDGCGYDRTYGIRWQRRAKEDRAADAR